MNRWSEKKQKNRIKTQFGKNPMDMETWESLQLRMHEIEMYEQRRRKDSNQEWVDDVTWNDLEMDRVFARINHTRTYMGEQILYHRLHGCKNRQELQRMEKRIAFFSCQESSRIKVEEKLSHIGKQKENYYLPLFLMDEINWPVTSCIGPYLQQVLLVICLAGTVLTRSNVWAIGLLVVATVNLLIYLHAKNKYEGNLFAVANMKVALDFCNWMIKSFEGNQLYADEEILQALEKTRKLAKQMGRWQARKYQSVTGDLAGIVQDYLAGVTLYDIVAFCHIEKGLRKCRKETLQLYEFVGDVDTDIAIASFRKSLKNWCSPMIQESGFIKMEKICHPLMDDGVANSIELRKGAIFTGANASGKSTFMKAVAINVILAQTIHTCVAKNVKMPTIKVMTSMTLRDDVVQKESYYMREMKYLKRMLDEIEKGEPVLFVIDEILKGTNTLERLGASKAILSYMAQKPGFLLVATHDLELVKAEENLYETYYFDSQIFGKDIIFPYKMKPGIAVRTNAIDLMEMMDFPEEITDKARAMSAK